MKKISEFLSESFHFFVVKFSVYLNRLVFVMVIILLGSWNQLLCFSLFVASILSVMVCLFFLLVSLVGYVLCLSLFLLSFRHLLERRVFFGVK